MHNRHTLGLLKIPYLYCIATLEYYAHTVTYYYAYYSY